MGAIVERQLGQSEAPGTASGGGELSCRTFEPNASNDNLKPELAHTPEWRLERGAKLGSVGEFYVWRRVLPCGFEVNGDLRLVSATDNRELELA